MELKALSRLDAIREISTQLSVPNSECTLTAELLAAGLRRAASLMCPTTPTALVLAVEQSLSPIFPDENKLRNRCRDMLEGLLALGDLMEYERLTLSSEESNDQRRLIYAAPPYFVELSDTRLILLGIPPDTIDQAPDDLQLTISGHVRSVSARNQTEARQILLQNGFHEVPYASWAKAPKIQSSSEVVGEINRLLDLEGPCGELESLRVIDSSILSPWYKERWVNPRGLNGRFVGTRPRKYGADLWCYVELDDGRPKKLLDLPQGRSLERGCDQAWRLQCALDAERCNPQSFNFSVVDSDRVRLDIHIPCPNWLQRRWDCIGERAGENVFSYVFKQEDRESESEILQNQLWMIPA